MAKVKYTMIIAFLTGFIGCAGITTVGSENHKATILYFEGGGGQISHFSDGKLINRSNHKFQRQGIIVKYMALDLPWPKFAGLGVAERQSDEHFFDIQEKVNYLEKKGHDRIWLMGISMGVYSVINAGANQIQGVEGLVVINAPNIGLPMGALDKIELPILAVTHIEDGGPLKHLSSDLFKRYCSSSTRAEFIAFSGGHTGTSSEATQLSQRYQHGLSGLEDEFTQVVNYFIDSNGRLSNAN